MDQNTILSSLKEEVSKICKEYSFVTFKIEYNATRDICLCSYQSARVGEDYERFCKSLLMLSDYLNDCYGVDAPLFTENQELFKLSANAEVIGGFVGVEITEVNPQEIIFNSPYHNGIKRKRSGVWNDFDASEYIDYPSEKMSRFSQVIMLAA